MQIKSKISIIAVGLSLGLVQSAIAAQERLENEQFVVLVDTTESNFSIQAKSSGKTFLNSGNLSGNNFTVKSVETVDKVLGKGKALELTYPNGNRERVALYPGCPFVTFRSIFHNAGNEPVVLNHVKTVSAAVNLDKSVAQLRTLGTAGLQTPDRNPGSYAFLTVADPETRAGVVGGWLTHNRGSGVVFSPVKDDVVRIQAQLDYGKLRIKPGEDAEGEMFALGYFDDARFGLEAYADAIAKIYSIKLLPQTPGLCTWYMEKYGCACDEKHLPELTAIAAKELKPFGFDFIQIDDEWQEGIKVNGPKKNFTTHKPNGPYPSGMKATADELKRLGMTPGIWFMPFAGTHNDPYFKDHQDWFVKNTKGEPYDTVWGGTCLDMTHPGAKEHVRGIVDQIANQWGFKVFKMDGFWTGSGTKQVYVNDGYRDDGIGDATFFDPDKTNVEALRDGAKLVRQTAGPNVFLLGCCVPQNMRSFGGSFGLLDAMRVGPDTSGKIGAPHGSRLWFLNGRVWWNDPDCVYVRKGLRLEEARLNASWVGISGQLFYVSDWMPETPAERLDIMKRCIPSHGQTARPVDVFESPTAQVWLVTDTRGTQRKDVVALYNWGREAKQISSSVTKIGLPASKEYVGFDYWSNRFVPPFTESISSELPGESCKILSIRPVSDHPQLLSTSRHVTQGIIDVVDENWNSSSKQLSATSSVVANDPYELRIVLPTSSQLLVASNVTVSPEDLAAGVKVTYNQNGPRLRVNMTSPVSRAVKWSVAFKKGEFKTSALPAVTDLKADVEYSQIKLSWADNGADQYRVTRADGNIIFTSEANYTDRNFTRDKPARYTVEAVNWKSISPAASVEVTPLTKIVLPPTPPLPAKYINDLAFTTVKNGWQKPQINKNTLGGPLRLNGKTYDKGLGLHAEALIQIPIPTGSKRFVATVGIEDGIRYHLPKMRFEVYGDVLEMGEKPVLLCQSPDLAMDSIPLWHFDVELNSRYKEIRLVVAQCGSPSNAQANVVNAGFIIDQK
jgi:hypothetical protein